MGAKLSVRESDQLKHRISTWAGTHPEGDKLLPQILGCCRRTVRRITTNEAPPRLKRAYASAWAQRFNLAERDLFRSVGRTDGLRPVLLQWTKATTAARRRSAMHRLSGYLTELCILRYNLRMSCETTIDTGGEPQTLKLTGVTLRGVNFQLSLSFHPNRQPPMSLVDPKGVTVYRGELSSQVLHRILSQFSTHTP